MARLYTRHYACETVIALEDLDKQTQCEIEALNVPSDQVLDLLDAASDALAEITLLPVGRCTKVYRPCRDSCRYFDCHCSCEIGRAHV